MVALGLGAALVVIGILLLMIIVGYSVWGVLLIFWEIPVAIFTVSGLTKGQASVAVGIIYILLLTFLWDRI